MSISHNSLREDFFSRHTDLFSMRATTWCSRECIGSAYKSSQPRWPLTKGEQAPRTLISFQANWGRLFARIRSPVTPRRDRSPLLPKKTRRPFSTRQRSSAIDPRRSDWSEGGQCRRRDREQRRAALSGIPDLERHSRVFCFFLRPLSGRTACTPLERDPRSEAVSLDSPRKSNLNKHFIISRLSSEKY